MLRQNDIDAIKQSIQDGKDTYLYYVAHAVECREGLIDEHTYKSISKFRVIKIKITDVNNAYREVLNFKAHPENYHTEQEESYLNDEEKHIFYYTVPNKKDSYDKDFTSSMPSIIYGRRRKLYFKDESKPREFNDPSPVKPIYTNNIRYGKYTPEQVKEAKENGLLDWKYIFTDDPVMNNGIEYNAITSDWYILDIENFPRTEKPLINVKQYSCYFINLNDAINYSKQLEA